MIYIFNLVGIGFAFIGILIFIGIALLSNRILPPYCNSVMVSMISAGCLIALDVWYRCRLRGTDEKYLARLLKPSAGGQLFFIPIWVMAAAIFIAGIFLPKTIPAYARPLNADEAQLKKSELSGDSVISGAIKQLFVNSIKEEINPSRFKVFSRMDEDRILVLVLIPNLDKFSKKAKGQAADLLLTYLNQHYPFKKHFFGLHGGFRIDLAYTPETGIVNTNSIQALASFYQKE